MKKTVNVLIIIFFLAFSSIRGYASQISEAEAAYNSGNYSEAVEIYKSVMDAEGVSGALYFDLGNAYYKAGQLGDAVLCFERAKKLDPGNKSIINNLNFTSSKVVDVNKSEAGEKKSSVEYDSPTFLQSINAMIAESVSSDNWAVLAVIAFILFLAMASMYFFIPNVLARKTGFFGGLTFLVFSIIFIIFSFVAASYVKSDDMAVIMTSKIKLLEKPETDSKTVSSALTDGTKVEILESEESKGGSSQWFKVKLNSRTVGWVNSKDLEII